jgi:hypothetical protein
MFCARCGTQVDDSATFCGSCGAPASGGITPGGAAYATQDTSTGLVVGSIICSIVALIFIPPLFGGLGIWLSSKVKKTNEGLGSGLMWFAGLCLFGGMALGALIFLS